MLEKNQVYWTRVGALLLTLTAIPMESIHMSVRYRFILWVRLRFGVLVYRGIRLAWMVGDAQREIMELEAERARVERRLAQLKGER